MGISSYLSKFALGITPEGLLSPTYGGTGTTTGAGAGGNSPTITSIVYTGDDTATSTAGGSVTINGTNFNIGVTVLVADVQATQVTRVSATQLTFVAPANTAGNYILYVVNTDGGVAISVPGIQYSGVPTWTTGSGSLGNSPTSTSFTTTIAATGDAPILYSIVSGALPAGITLNTSTGVISGTTPNLSSSTLYNFTIRATDAQNQDTNRAFSLNVNTGPQGQALFTIADNQSWTCPVGVTRVCVMMVGGGGSGGNTDSVNNTGAGGGGGLLWANDIQVTPGQSYHVKVGGGGYYPSGDGESSAFAGTFAALGGKGGNGPSGRTGGAPSVYGGSVSYGSQGGGSGGNGGMFFGSGVGGGGAGGYTGNGGNGAPEGYVPTTGSGGGGGGAVGGNGTGAGFGGGGVGLLGQGANGGQGGAAARYGGGGSGGGNGGSGPGGVYGGGAGYGGGNGGGGAVRIIWGSGRAFPSTNTADV